MFSSLTNGFHQSAVEQVQTMFAQIKNKSNLKPDNCSFLFTRSLEKLAQYLLMQAKPWPALKQNLMGRLMGAIQPNTLYSCSQEAWENLGITKITIENVVSIFHFN